MSDTKPCACTLTECPQNIRGSFDRIEWALGHLEDASQPCLKGHSDSWRNLQRVRHRLAIRATGQNQIRSSVAVHRDLFSTILGEVDSESEIAQMIRELGVE
jgi:hypothetical protein